MPTSLPPFSIPRQLESLITRPARRIGISADALRRFWLLFYTLCEFCWGGFLGISACFAYGLTGCALSDIRRYLSAEEGGFPTILNGEWQVFLIIVYFIAVPLGTWGWIGSMRSYFYHRRWGQYTPPTRLLSAVLIQSGSLILLLCAISLAVNQLTPSRQVAESVIPYFFFPGLPLSLCVGGIFLLQYVRFRLNQAGRKPS